MTDYQKIVEVLMDELPDDNPWQGNVKGLVDLITNGAIARDPECKTLKIKLPGRVKGHWHSRTLDKNGLHLYGVQCSVCSFFAFGKYEQYLHMEKFKFCPECGCAMRGEEE